MRRIAALTMLMCAVLALGLSPPASADDVMPPYWRGEPNTTFQHWTFSSGGFPPLVPEYYTNPYGEPWLDFMSQFVWHDEFAGRLGVVNAYVEPIEIYLPNNPEPNLQKRIWLQITYLWAAGWPEFYEVYFPDELWDQWEWVDTVEHPDGWCTDVISIVLPENPEYEFIYIYFGSPGYIDQIVVDTWCNGGGGGGACCVDGECVATNTKPQCDEMGGCWYEGEDCFGIPPFVCPTCEGENVIHDNGEPDGANGLSAERRLDGSLARWVVDDVTFMQTVTIRDLHWWTIEDEGFNWNHTDDLIILDDAGGMPGDVVEEMWDVPNIRCDTGMTLFDRPVYFYTIRNIEIQLPAGTYWIGMRPVQGVPTGGQSYWATAPGGGSAAYLDYNGYWQSTTDYFGVPYDVAFCVTGDLDDEIVKYAQPFSCDEYLWFSNVNANPAYNWLKFDDFICTQTGDITKIVFWGGGWDVSWLEGCDIFQNLAAVQIDIYEWLPGGPCDWQYGPLLCSNTIPVEELNPVFECYGPWGTEEYYRFTANLPEPCYQHEEEHYVLMIAGVLINPDDPCVFGWVGTPGFYNSPGYSWQPPDTWECDNSDNAFELYMEREPCPWDFDNDGDVDTADLLHLLGCWGTPCGDVDGDGDTDTADLLSLLGAWGQCP